MNANEIKKSLKENGYDKTLELVIKDTKICKMRDCFGTRFNYESFAKAQIEDAIK